MQMLCNIFPILSLQLLKRSSFKQFLILKKNIYGMTVNGAWSFEQTLNHECEIWWQLAKWFLKNHDFIHVNSTVAGKYNKNKQDGSHLGFPIRMTLATADLQVTSILPMNFESIVLLVLEKKFKMDFQDGHHGHNLGFPIRMIWAIFDLQVTPMLPT